MFLAKHTICSSDKARSISAVPSGLDLPFLNLANTARHHVGRLQSPGPHCPTLPPFQNTLFVGLQMQFALSRNSDLKYVCVESSDGRQPKFLLKNSPIEVIATFPLHWRWFRLACFHLSLSSESPSSPPQKTIATFPFHSRRSTLQLLLQIADDLILLAFSTCLVRICSARQETKKSLSCQSAPKLSPKQRDFAVQRGAQGICFFLPEPETPALRTV